MRPPFISVVVTTHHRPVLLERAIRSVHDQGCGEIEVIVVADENSAGTAIAAQRVLKEGDTFIRRSGQPGPARSRNLGVSLAAGSSIVFLDDDDTLAPGLLQAVARCDRLSARQIAYWDYRHIIENRADPEHIVPLQEIAVVQGEFDPRSLFVKNRIPNCCMAFPTEVLRCHPFDESLRSLEDWDALLALLSAGMELNYIAEVESYYHHEVGNVHRNPVSNEVLLPDYIYIYRKWPAPDAEIRSLRQSMLADAGLQLPSHWF